MMGLWLGLALGADRPEILGCGRRGGSVASSCPDPVAGTVGAPARRVFLSRREAADLRSRSCDAVSDPDGRTPAMTLDTIPGRRTLDTVVDFAGGLRGLRIGGGVPAVHLDGVPVSDEWTTGGRPSASNGPLGPGGL